MEIKKVELLGASEKTLTIASGCVIIQDKKVLLVRRNNNNYKFPGGTINDLESFQETAIREVLEEISCKIEIAGTPIFYQMYIENNYYLLIHYPAEIIEGIPKPTSEIEEVKWFDLDNLPGNCFENVKSVIQKLKEQ